MKLLISCLLAGLACAQSTPQLEVRGTVVEAGLGVADAEITLFEFLLDSERAVVRTVASMAGEGGKPTESAGTPAYVDREHPVQEVRFSLLRPGEITGRVVDDDDNPVTGLAIAVQHRATCVVFGPDPRAVTDSCRCRRHTVRFCYARKVGQAFLPAAGFLAGVVYPTTAVRRGTCASRRDCFPDRCTRTSRRWRSMESPNRPTT